MLPAALAAAALLLRPSRTARLGTRDDLDAALAHALCRPDARCTVLALVDPGPGRRAAALAAGDGRPAVPQAAVYATGGRTVAVLLPQACAEDAVPVVDALLRRLGPAARAGLAQAGPCACPDGCTPTCSDARRDALLVEADAALHRALALGTGQLVVARSLPADPSAASSRSEAA